MVNGGVLKPDGTTIINDVIPEFRVKLSEDVSGYDGVNAVRLEFLERPDGVTPQAVAGQMAYDPETKTFKYRVPFEENAILFPGDQWLKVSATDRAGNKSTRTVKFAVGAHNREGMRTTQALGEPPVFDPPAVDYVPRGIDQAGKQVHKFDARILFYRTTPPEITPAVRALIMGSGAVVFGATFVFYDEIVHSVGERLEKGVTFKIYSEPFGGDVLLTDLDRDHALLHKEISLPLLEAAIKKTNDGTTDPRFEIWMEPVKPGQVSKEFLLVFRHLNGHIFMIPIRLKSGTPHIVTAWGAGAWKNFPVPPTPFEQWNGVIRKTTFVRKADNDLGRWKVDNPDPSDPGDGEPQYRLHFWGLLPDDLIKPYSVQKGLGKPLKDRWIVKVPGLWRN